MLHQACVYAAFFNSHISTFSLGPRITPHIHQHSAHQMKIISVVKRPLYLHTNQRIIFKKESNRVPHTVIHGIFSILSDEWMFMKAKILRQYQVCQKNDKIFYKYPILCQLKKNPQIMRHCLIRVYPPLHYHC